MGATLDEVVPGAVEIDPFADRVIRLVGGVPLGLLGEDRHVRERHVLAAMVEVQMAVDDRADPLDRHACVGERLADGQRRRLVLGELGMALADARVEEDPAAVSLDGVDDHDPALAGQRPIRPLERRDLDRNDAHVRPFVSSRGRSVARASHVRRGRGARRGSSPRR